MDNETLATELIRELKAHRKGWFIIALVEAGIILIMVLGLFWYFSLPVDEVSIENEDGNANYIGNNLEGDLYNGKDSEKTESGKKSQS